VLTNVVVGAILLIHIGPLESRIWHILLVYAPAHLGSLEEVDDGFRTSIDPLEAIVCDAVRARAACYDVVWL
jgi:hypothetical protein